MEILNFSDNGKSGPGKSAKGRAFTGFGLIAAALGLSSTLAANISINSGPVEFGQGVAQTVACSGDESVIVTPATSFTNAPSSVTREATFYGSDTFTVTSTADLTVGMVLSLPTNPEYVITEINGLEVRMSYQGLNEGTVLPVTFYPSRGTEQTTTPYYWVDGGDIGESYMELFSDGIEAGMLVSGPGIAAQTVVVGIYNVSEGQQYIELNKETEYSSGSLTFTNSGQSSFKLSDITVSNIPDTCNGKVFTIKLYDNESAEPLKISNWEGGDSSVQVWWANGYQSGNFDPTDSNEAVVQFPTSYRVFFDNMATAYNDDYAFETNSNNQSISSGAFKVNLPITVDASRVYKITVETQDDSDSLNLDEGGFNFYGFWQQFKMR